MTGATVRLWPLAVAQFCGIAALFTHVSLTTVIAKEWIHDSQLPGHHGDKIPNGVATLPVALLVFFSAMVIAPAGRFMQFHGYQKVFHGGALCGVVSSILCVLAILFKQTGDISSSSSFAFLCCATIPQGLAYGVVYYYRHVGALVGKAAAVAAGEPEQHGMARAVAYVITSGAFAGVAGPGLADAFNNVIPHHKYVGTYAALGLVNLFHFFILFLCDSDAVFRPPAAESSALGAVNRSPTMTDEEPPRPLLEIVCKPNFLQAMLSSMVAHTSMLLAMAATPLVLHGKVQFEVASAVIQVHVLCMYLPSFGSSKLIARFGAIPVTIVGLAIGLVGGITLQVEPPATWPFYSVVMIALIIIGIGWNLSYVGATAAVAGCYRANERFTSQAFNDTVVFTMGSAGSLCAGVLYHYVELRNLSAVVITTYAIALVANLVKVVWDRQAKPLAPSVPAATSHGVTIAADGDTTADGDEADGERASLVATQQR